MIRMHIMQQQVCWMVVCNSYGTSYVYHVHKCSENNTQLHCTVNVSSYLPMCRHMGEIPKANVYPPFVESSALSSMYVFIFSYLLSSSSCLVCCRNVVVTWYAITISNFAILFNAHGWFCMQHAVLCAQILVVKSFTKATSS